MKINLSKLLLLVGVILSSSSFAQRINIPGGAPNFKPSVASPVSLPPTGNTPGDARVSISNASIYIWDGAAWQGTAGGGAAAWGGITGTLSSQTDLNTALGLKEDVANKDTDGTLAANSDTKYPSQKATKTYVDTGLATKENTITATTSADYYRGDKTFQTLNTTAVPEGTNLYYTDGRFDTRFGTKTTDGLSEGAINLYFTDARAQAASISQVITNGVTTKAPSEDAVFDALALKQSTSEKDQNNGYAGLDAGGKIAVSALPNTVMTFEGQWNANTNTPALADGVGNAGDVWRANVAGTTDFGSGPIAFNLGDWAVYNGTIWEYASNSNLVMSVNGQQGVVVLDTDDIAEGTNLYFTDARAIAAPLTGFTSGAGTVVATDSILQSIQKLDGNINAATVKTPNTIASFDGSGVLQSHPNWNITADNNFNLNDTSNSTSGYTVMSANKNGDVSGGTTQGYNFYVNGNIEGYYGFTSNLQGTSNGQVEHLSLFSSQNTTGNYFMINGNMTGDVTSGGVYGLNMSASGLSDNFSPVNASNTGNTGYLNGFSLSNSGTIATGFNAVNAVNSGNADYVNGFAFNNSGNTTNGFSGVNLFNSGNVRYQTALNYSNSGTFTDGSQLVNVIDSGTGPSLAGVNVNLTGTYSSDVTGISVNVTGATSPGKTGIANNGALNSNSSIDTATVTPPASFALNYLGGQFKVSSGFPTTDEFGFGNNLATSAVFDDDMPADFTGLNLGYTHVGFVGAVSIASGKTVNAMNMALGGAGVQSGSGGTITYANVFRAEGFLNQGGSLTATNMRGFYAGTQLCGMATDCWGFFDEAGGENYLGKLAIGTASKKAAAGKAFDLLGDALITGDMNVTGIATLGNGSVATTQSANDNSTKIATTAYVDSAVTSSTSSTYTIANISTNTTLNAATASAYFVDTTGGAITVTLPLAASNTGKFFLVKHTTFGGANDIAVARSGADLIEGGTSDTLTAGMSRKYVSNGTDWYIEE